MKPTIQIDRQMLEDVQRRLGDMEKKAPQVISSALNRAITNVASNISKETRLRYNVKSKDVKSTLEKTRASKANMEAIVRSTGTLLPLDRFRVSPRKVTPKRKAPIKAGVKKGGMKPVKGAFVGDIHGIKVFRRQGKARLPIERLFGPSVPQMLQNEESRERINEEGREMFYRRLDHEINRILEKGSGT